MIKGHTCSYCDRDAKAVITRGNIARHTCHHHLELCARDLGTELSEVSKEIARITPQEE